MAEPFLGEIRLMSFVFAPRGWALCNGQLLPINTNQALFSLLGTQYGGNGQVNFALPDLRGRVPLHLGAGRVTGARGGEQAHTLSMNEMPQHTHVVRAAEAATGGSASASGRYLGGGNNVYRDAGSTVGLSAETVSSSGGSQAHTNMQPYLTISFCIAMQGIYPSRD